MDYYATLFHRILVLHVGEQLSLIGSGPSRNGGVFGPLVENIAMVNCLMAAELDNGYDGLDDAVWPLQATSGSNDGDIL